MMFALGPTEWHCSICGMYTTAKANNNSYHPLCQKCQKETMTEIMSWLAPRKMVDGDLFS